MPALGAFGRRRFDRSRQCRRNRLHHLRREGAVSSKSFRPSLFVQVFSSSVVSAKPRAMNRTGLIVALALALVVGLLFGIFPELDLKLASVFYDAPTRSFPLKSNTLAAIARDGAMVIAWAFALPA